MLTLGGMGYAQEYHVERYLREVLIPRTAPVGPHMILNFLAEKVLDHGESLGWNHDRLHRSRAAGVLLECAAWKGGHRRTRQ
jgi:hypothetical protein